MSKPKKPWQYGDPPPKNWQECSDAMKTLPSKKAAKKNPLLDRLDSLEQFLKDHK